MKLTNAIRDKIVADVLNDKGLHKAVENAEKAWALEIANEWEKGYPPRLEEFKAWVQQASAVYVCTENGNTEDYVNLPGHIVGKQVYCQRSGTPHVARTAKIIELKDEILAARRVLKDAETLLRQVVYSCTTSKQLIDTAPELARFVPDEGQTTALVSVETVNALRQFMNKDVP